MAEKTAQYWIQHLDMQQHPEGGYYKETYRSAQQVNRAGDEKRLQACTSIYYLLEGIDYSGFHRIQSDEIWYFHAGVPLYVHVITAGGEHQVLELSDQPTGNLSLVVPAGLWFAAEIPSKTGYTLVSCAVAPGFEFTEFEMADKISLTTKYPYHREIFEGLCR